MYEIQVKVCFCEIDVFGYINNMSYFIYLEEVCIVFFEEMGVFMYIKKWEYILVFIKCDFVV